MSSTPNPRRGQAGTYLIQNRVPYEGLSKLAAMDQMMTTGMGGVLSEQPDPIRFQAVLDVSCGSGNWLITLAQTYPAIPKLVGTDINEEFLDYGRKQAKETQVSERVEFRKMDALGFLDFPAATFDLLNLRMGRSYLRTWDWPNLLDQFWRILQPEGTIRLTESDYIIQSSSPALMQLYTFLREAFYRSGHLFTEQGDGESKKLASLLQQNGIHEIQEKLHILEYRAGTPEGHAYYENQKFFFRINLPFLRKWTRLPDNYEDIYQRALSEMQEDNFFMHRQLITIWGKRPPKTLIASPSVE